MLKVPISKEENKINKNLPYSKVFGNKTHSTKRKLKVITKYFSDEMLKIQIAIL